MRVAVVTPFYQVASETLNRCLASVAAQTVRCERLLVCDGDEPTCVPNGVEVIRLPRPHLDYGNAARAIGAVSAACRGFDAIAFLDSDNWYEPNHVAGLLDAIVTVNAAVGSSGRRLFDSTGKAMGICPEVDGDRFVDTNCLLLTRAAYGLIAPWYCMPAQWTIIGDRVVWKAIKDSGLPRTHLAVPTVNYTTLHRSHYLYFGLTPPEDAKSIRVELSPQQVRDFGG